MWNLVVKDFAVQTRTIGMYLVLAAAFLLVFSTTGAVNQVSILLPVYVITYGFINRAFYEDEKTNNLRMLAALPVERRIIVRARYVSTLLTIGISLLGSLGIGLGMGIFGAGSSGDMIPQTLMMVSFVCFFLIFFAIYLPLAFRLGYIKASGINRFIFIGIFAFGMSAGMVIKVMMKQGEAPEFIRRLAEWVINAGPGGIIMTEIIVTGLLFGCSMLVAEKWFEKRNVF